jgi:short-subunit dehydrogenase
VTVVPAGPTETPLLAKLGLTPERMPVRPMKPEQCAAEGLRGLQENRPVVIPGRMNRIMNAMVPASITRSMMVKMFTEALAARSPSPQARAEVR